VRIGTKRFALALACAGALLPSAVLFAAGAAADASAGKPATSRPALSG